MKAIDVLFDWYPRYLKWPHQGRVVERNDPQGIGRIKARIPLYDGISRRQLPWCYPLVWTNPGKGRVLLVPDINEVVLVFFPYLDIHIPYYVPVYIRGRVPEELLVDYPDTYGVADDVGNFWRVNTKKQEIEIKHCSGAFFKIDCKGNITIRGRTVAIIEGGVGEYGDQE